VPILYRLASISGGVFVNPALTEPFGLTLIEAAASGVPIVATEDGGPNDILANCENGLLIDPLDSKAMAEAILAVIQDSGTWRDYSVSGSAASTSTTPGRLTPRSIWDTFGPPGATGAAACGDLAGRPALQRSRGVYGSGSEPRRRSEGLERFVQAMREHRKYVAFGIATGRKLKGALQLLRQLKVPRPDVLITSLGTKIHYAPRLVVDTAWREHIDHLWNPRAIHRVLGDVPGMLLQEKDQQSRFKISYYIDPQKAPPLDEIEKMLHQEEQSVHVMLSFGQFLDIVPVRASKGMAIRYVATKWGIPLDKVLAAGGSGADEDMMRGNMLSVVVANRHQEELSQLADVERIYFAKQPFAAGILEAIDHYDFFGQIRVEEN
jgi:sucrose-phosphate synthase